MDLAILNNFFFNLGSIGYHSFDCSKTNSRPLTKRQPLPPDVNHSFGC